ncbi:MAG: alpha/beta hydrolase-fold protein [Acidobacteriota bacterium]|nr:alpha/beta hydrolase-fold protein [Acidobacteriota bacterium]
MKKSLFISILIFFLFSLFTACRFFEGNGTGETVFRVYFTGEQSQETLDGRILVMVSSDGGREPRFQIGTSSDTQLIFGIDVEALKPGEEAVIDSAAFGYPLRSIADIPPGDYWVQALLNRYETFRRADGHTLKLPPDMGEGQKWNRKPGNFYSIPRKFRVNSGKTETIRIALDQIIPPLPEQVDSKYVKHVKIQSELLTEFWGRPTYLGANILLPEGFDEHPEARYPLVVNHGHFPLSPIDPLPWREVPPDPDLEPIYNERFQWEGYNRTVQEYAYKFYRYWTAPDTPRMIIISIQHPTPFFDDSYAVNSVNQGPYGDAINYELIPYIEKKFRGIGEGWARFLYGGSTGGWEALASQVFYPEEYNGCFAACPDSISFRSFFIVNIYEHRNAYFADSPWKKTPTPGNRNYLGEVSFTTEEGNHLELVLGTKSRSGGTWDIYNAVYSPVGEDGYPMPIWDKLTGEIDHDVAEYWRENYDLVHIMQRDWETLGPKLEGKIHIYVGDMDNWYLNNAVYWAEEFLESTKDPYYAGEIDYGDRQEHCWNGDQDRPNAISRLRYQQMFAPKMVERMLKTAPPEADTKSWRY